MRPTKILAGLIVLVFVAFLALNVLFTRVEPDELGVRVDKWGGGVVEEDFGPGFHLGIFGVHDWHRLDARTHFITFSETDRSTLDADRNSIPRPPLEIRTQDNPASVDVSVTYHIKRGEGHLLVAEGLRDSYRDRVTSTVVRVLREELAQLTPTEFVSTEIRLQRSAQALEELRKALKQFHVEPEHLLIRAVRFPESFEKKLQETQLRPQLAQLEKAKETVEDALARTGVLEKETEKLEKEKRGEWNKKLDQLRGENAVAIARIRGDAEIYDQRTRAEADAAYVSMVAEGELALAQVEALRDELRNAALDTAGGRIYQARAAAQNLSFGEVTLNSNDPTVPNIIDVDALVRLLVGRTAADEGGAQPAGN